MKNNDWILCSEELPKKNGTYIVTIEGISESQFLFWNYNKFIDKLYGEPCDTVIAWQPMPPIYKP